MVLNPSKCFCVCLGSKSVIKDFIHKDRTKMPLTMEYVTLEHKFIGIMIGTNLNVYSQLKQLCKNVANKFNVLTRIICYLDKK